MIPIQNSKNKIVIAIIFGLLVMVGLVVWYLNQPEKTSDQIRELTSEELVADLESNNVASSSPDFARRMAINELPDIGNFSNYKKDANHVYYGTDEIPNSDPDTFEIVNETFAKDKGQVYSKGKIIVGADSATFIATTTPYDAKSVFVETACSGSGYSIVYCYKKVEGADPKTFEHFFGNPFFSFSKDKDHVFYYEKMIPEADVQTFAMHDGGKYGYTYWYDKNYIFVMGYSGIGIIKEKCNEVDKISGGGYYLGGYYMRCDSKIYHFDTWLEDADSNAFRTIGVTGNYALDSKNVYFDGEVIGADPATFTIGDGINARDKDHVYRYGKVIE